MPSLKPMRGDSARSPSPGSAAPSARISRPLQTSLRHCGASSSASPIIWTEVRDRLSLYNYISYWNAKLTLAAGLEIDGREITRLDPEQIREAARRISAAGITKVALVGIFSPLDHSGIHEEACKKIMLEVDPGLSVVCSHTIGGVGLLERENATILNASILQLAQKTVRAFVQAMSDLKLTCSLYLTQNDGTLTDAVTASELPIKTFASGPTNSLTGAAFLASLDRRTGSMSNAERQTLVIDIGGTTSDICALMPSGFPRQASNFVEVGGVRTMFSMPEVLSIGLGGGSIVRQDGTHVSVGPDSVGHYLTSKAKVFGGDTLTTTDIVVAAGKEQIGDASEVADVTQQTIEDARKAITKLLSRGIESMKVSSLPVTVLLVGGGSIVYMDDLQGVEECIIPPHHDSANAVGAAIAKVAGTADVIEILAGKDENEVLKQVQATAVDMAIQRGADRDTVKIAEIEKLPLQYVTNKATRIMVKAVGKLRVPTEEEAEQERAKLPAYTNGTNGANGHNGNGVEGEKAATAEDVSRSAVKHSIYVDIPLYKPEVENGVWYLSPLDLEFIASGTGVLGTGGGGPSYQQYLIALECLRKKGKRKMRVVKPESMADTDVCVFASWYGAPSVSSERIPQGNELIRSVEESIKLTRHEKFHAIMADEIGGGNGMVTFPTAVHYDIPTIDGDLMGRAYPTIQHGTPYVYGETISPCALADSKGNVSVVMHAESNQRIETMLRTTCVELGLFTSVSAAPLTGKAIKKYAVENTMSQAWYLGRAIHLARREKVDVIEAIFKTTPGRLLYTGKIIDVHRDVSRGYTMGYCILAPLSSDEVADSYDNTNSTSSSSSSTETQPHLIIPFQNEYLYAAHVSNLDKPQEAINQDVICTVPDLISILDKDGEAVGSQELKYGLRVRVIGMAAHPLWTQDQRGLDVGGPKYFGLDMEWKSIGKYQRPRSVIDEFNVVV
ncbi:hypothetical protein H112_06007 [Trichophyton rubrum D6]|uniref:Uncharacterized protein n=2 Tax=Trichophyton rubrum TaxID=5551 RepID=F2SLN4_TRIRC|nr:uncharacterized protein TERG_03712 [Trichophyton rubrum CBS 118892]EZF14837.1 hypothetical protein H100_06021 [Trichophyton rubrum MR850]EZF39954.1 hypothetical protein H102_05990 [Trichophyton rubrum CBS 100081]EZF50594.1 hypothetical protein H103_06015 [Trichophyton rubrum CBS 288.86]EZF61138.1 hypothetical protein H104_06003 [Trichophyton rubrum CBS 289.86]EZF82354.1 hypothetical protein H110_06011 [Trichophyton rubrum MR1448]EZF93030.1 hypothetical protein H113_06058 [Trichophyton rubr